MEPLPERFRLRQPADAAGSQQVNGLHHTISGFRYWFGFPILQGSPFLFPLKFPPVFDRMSLSCYFTWNHQKKEFFYEPVKSEYNLHFLSTVPAKPPSICSPVFLHIRCFMKGALAYAGASFVSDMRRLAVPAGCATGASSFFAPFTAIKGDAMWKKLLTGSYVRHITSNICGIVIGTTNERISFERQDDEFEYYVRHGQGVIVASPSRLRTFVPKQHTVHTYSSEPSHVIGYPVCPQCGFRLAPLIEEKYILRERKASTAKRKS